MIAKLEITEIQLFGTPDNFSANIAINDDFMIQLGTDDNFTIPFSNEAIWNDKNKQDAAAEQYDADDLAELLEVRQAIEDVMPDPIYWYK